MICSRTILVIGKPLRREVLLSSSSSSSSSSKSTSKLLCPSNLFHSRAHPQPIPQYPIPVALAMTLQDIELRNIKRREKWERNLDKLRAKHKDKDFSSPYQGLDETLELAINLNIDPRKPGQSLRGSLLLPHGTGKSISCIVFTKDQDLIQKYSDSSSNNNSSSKVAIGNDDLVDAIMSGSIDVSSYERGLATQDCLSSTSKVARILGPRGLMPSAKLNTVFDTPQQLEMSLLEQSNKVQYRTETNGIIHLPIGKASFGPEKLTDNIRAICQTVQDLKPDNYGKGKKKSKTGKNVKYWLKTFISSTQGKSVKVDLRTIEPSSAYFMGDPNAE